MELWQEQESLKRQLNEALRTLKTNGSAYADAEKKYKEAVSIEALKLRDEGMAVTLMDKVIYGLPSISMLRFNRDVAKVVYEANQEAINVKKLELRIIESQLQREWSNTKK